MSQHLPLEGIGMTSRRTRERLVNRLREQGIVNDQVLAVMLSTPRHLFLDEALAHRAYEDTALPIGYNQTLSQPYIVARMTELILQKGEVRNVLEVGTGSGYQTAVLAQLADKVYSVERIGGLQQKAKQRLRTLGLRNVYLNHSDGEMGWPVMAPFDAIVVTAAPSQVPESLLEQLAPGGWLVIPVGEQEQTLMRISKDEQGNLYHEAVEPVRFVPLLSGVLT